jgi:hypothetical protein
VLAVALVGEQRADEVRELARLAVEAEGPLPRVLKAPVVVPERLPTPASRRLAGAARALRERAARLLRSCRSRPPAPGSLLALLLDRARATGTGVVALAISFGGDAVGHLMQLVVHDNRAPANVWSLPSDVLQPLLAIGLLVAYRRTRRPAPSLREAGVTARHRAPR